MLQVFCGVPVPFANNAGSSNTTVPQLTQFVAAGGRNLKVYGLGVFSAVLPGEAGEIWNGPPVGGLTLKVMVEDFVA